MTFVSNACTARGPLSDGLLHVVEAHGRYVGRSRPAQREELFDRELRPLARLRRTFENDELYALATSTEIDVDLVVDLDLGLDLGLDIDLASGSDRETRAA